MNRIVFAAPHYYSSFIQVGAQHYARVLSKNSWNVLYFSNYLSPFNLFLSKDRRDIGSRLSNHIHGGERINPNLFAYVPFSFLPHHNFTIFDKRWFLDNAYRFTVPPVTGILRKHLFENVDVLWIDCPNQIFWKNIIGHTKSIYRIFDDIEAFQKVGPVLMEAHEEALLSSDVVIVTSKALIKDLTRKYKDVSFRHCPNGVDLTNFLREEYVKPNEFKNIKGRKALYVGAIDDWFDENLLAYIASHSPEIDFCVIGPDRLGKMSGINQRNIHYLGPKPFKEIPNYMFYADFGIIPFKSNRLVRCVNPIKMYEYFSLGRQVISTSWEELELLKVPCLLANNKEEFLEYVNGDQVLYPDNRYLTQYAKENTWENRLRDILGLL
jgi:hypothetical protein